jgi:hypothetical protein
MKDGDEGAVVGPSESERAEAMRGKRAWTAPKVVVSTLRDTLSGLGGISDPTAGPHDSLS